MPLQRDAYAQDMFNALAAVAPNGLTRNQLLEALNIIPAGATPTSRQVVFFHHVKGHLQDILGATDLVTMVGEQTVGDQGWIYRLEGDPTAPVSRLYLIQKTRGIFKRQSRSFMVIRSLAAGINGNTTAGRYIRRLARSQYRTLEDTVDVLVDLGEPAPSLPPQI